MSEILPIVGVKGGVTISSADENAEAGGYVSGSLGLGFCVSGCDGDWPKRLFGSSSLSIGVAGYGGYQNGAGAFGGKFVVGNFHYNGGLRAGVTKSEGASEPFVGMEATVPAFELIGALLTGDAPLGTHPLIPTLNIALDLDPTDLSNRAFFVGLGLGF